MPLCPMNFEIQAIHQSAQKNINLCMVVLLLLSTDGIPVVCVVVFIEAIWLTRRMWLFI